MLRGIYANHYVAAKAVVACYRRDSLYSFSDKESLLQHLLIIIVHFAL